MNLLFYQASRGYSFPKTQGRNRRNAHSLLSARKLVIFFRYFKPEGFEQYILNCRRANRNDVDYLRNFIRFHGRNWWNRYFHDMIPASHLVNIMNDNAGTTTLSDIINASFSWSNTPQGGEYWRQLHHLFGDFCRFLRDHNVDCSASLETLDELVYPNLGQHPVFRVYIVNSLPDATVEQEEQPERRSSNSRRARASTVGGRSIQSVLDELALGSVEVEESDIPHPEVVEEIHIPDTVMEEIRARHIDGSSFINRYIPGSWGTASGYSITYTSATSNEDGTH